jgi:hypothetical protein
MVAAGEKFWGALPHQQAEMLCFALLCSAAAAVLV